MQLTFKKYTSRYIHIFGDSCFRSHLPEDVSSPDYRYLEDISDSLAFSHGTHFVFFYDILDYNTQLNIKMVSKQ